MKWLKNNWFYLLLVGIIVFILTDSVVKSGANRKEINAKSDSIQLLKDQYHLIEEHEAEAWKTIKNDSLTHIIYQDSLQSFKIAYINQKQRHAKQVADLNRIPTDTLYRELTGQLNSLSLLW